MSNTEAGLFWIIFPALLRKLLSLNLKGREDFTSPCKLRDNGVRQARC